MSEEATELVEPTFDDGADSSATPAVETIPSDVTTDAGTEQSDTPALSEQDPQGSLINDQPTTPKLVDPFPEAVAPKPVAPVPSALPPELEAISKDPARLQRFINLEKLHGQQSNELGQLRKIAAQWDGLDRQQVESVLQQQQRAAAQAQLNPWNRDHPQNRDFSSVRERRRIDDLRLSRVAPEQRDAVRQALDADYTPDELAQLKSYDAYRRKEEMLTPEDREDRMRETARREAREEIQQLLNYQAQTKQTHDFMAKHPDLLTKDKDLLARALDDRTPRSELAAEIATLKAQVAELVGHKSKDIEVVSTARAQTANAQRTAAIGRDGAQPRRKADPVAEALRRKDREGALYDPFDDLVQAREDTPEP